VKDLNEHEFRSSLFLFYDSYLVDRIQGQQHKILVKTKEYTKGKTKKPFHILFSEEYYLFISYMKMSFLRMVPSAIRMYSFLKKESPDIVHCNNSLRMNMDAILASRLAGIPCICHVRSLEKLYFINKLCSGFVKLYICISEAVRENYLKQGIKKEKLVLIPNGLDIRDFPIPERQNQAGYDFIITNIGRMADWKGQEILIKAIPHIIEKKKNVQFWLAGEGPERANLEEKVSDLKIDRYVKFKGVVPDIQTILSVSDLLVHTPTKPEPFGRVIIEAMSMQTPIVATNVGGPSEIITDGHDGILIEPNKPDQLAETILHMLDNPDLRQNIGIAARKTIMEQYDNKKIVKQVERIYLTILNKNLKNHKGLNRSKDS